MKLVYQKVIRRLAENIKFGEVLFGKVLCIAGHDYVRVPRDCRCENVPIVRIRYAVERFGE